MNSIQMSKIEINEQILFTKGESIFIGRIVEVREKAVKVDYCFESAWSNCQCTVFTYTTWIPKSQITNDEIGGLTVKNWFKYNMNPEKIYHIKKYFMKGERVCFV
jgi:hypothetical protein